jgi:3-oxoadipate enol-lactonase
VTVRDGFADTSFGRIHYLEKGCGSPLLLLHSNGCSAQEYRPAMEQLSERFRTIAWDMPGQGDSDPITRHLSIADYATAAIALLDSLNIGSVTVLGSSVGAAVAAELAASYPNRIHATVIVEIPLGRDRAWWETNWTVVERMFSVPEDTFDGMAKRYRVMTQELYGRLLVDRYKAGSKAMMSVMWAGRD